MVEKIGIRVERAYFDLSRAHLGAEIQHTRNDGSKECPNLIFALTSMAYVFSYAAINAFATSQLSSLWKERESEIKERFPKAKSFEHLLNSDLKELKEMLKELCRLWAIEPIHKIDPKLWEDLTVTITEARKFLIHPSPFGFHEATNTILSDIPISHPSNVASRIIGYFYEKRTGHIPDWLNGPPAFSIKSIQNRE